MSALPKLPHLKRGLRFYAAFLLLLGLWGAIQGRAAGLPIWELQDTAALAKWLLKQVGLALGAVLLFVPLGLLYVTSLGQAWPAACARRKAALLAIGCLGAMLLAFVAQALRARFAVSLATVAMLTLPVAGYGLGVWLGVSLLRPERPWRGFLAKLELLAAGGGLCAGVVMALGLERQPLAFAPASFNSEDKRRLVERLRGKDPRRIPPGQTVVFALTEDEANKLLAWGLSVGSEGRKARVQIGSEAVEFLTSVRLPWPRARPAYANLTATLAVRSAPSLRVRATRLRLGRLEFPGWLLRPLSAAFFEVWVHDAHIRPLYRAVQRCEVVPGQLTLTYGRVELPATYAADVASRMGLSGDLARATHAHVEALTRLALERGAGPLSMDDCLQAAFRLAQQRSLQGDPVTENRAAILALGILLGHDRLYSLVGEKPKESIPPQARQRFAAVRIQGRRDWTRHFAVSAALEVVANVVTSDAAGLLKEELDAGTGGSGFSFGDLLADRAGTRFAAQATRDAATARLVQARFQDGLGIQDIVPPAGDLPEGIRAQDFERIYGGVGGEKYSQLLQLIDARIAACRIYQ